MKKGLDSESAYRSGRVVASILFAVVVILAVIWLLTMYQTQVDKAPVLGAECESMNGEWVCNANFKGFCSCYINNQVCESGPYLFMDDQWTCRTDKSKLHDAIKEVNKV